MGSCAVKQPRRFMKQNLQKPEQDNPCAAPSLECPPCQPDQVFQEGVGQTCCGALLQPPLTCTGWQCRKCHQVPLTESIPCAEIKQTQNTVNGKFSVPSFPHVRLEYLLRANGASMQLDGTGKFGRRHSKTDFVASELIK